MEKVSYNDSTFDRFVQKFYEQLEMKLEDPIYTNQLYDPVTPSSGHSYNSAVVNDLSQKSPMDPQTRVDPLTPHYPNLAVRKIRDELTIRISQKQFNLDPFKAFCCDWTGKIIKKPVLDIHGHSFEEETIVNWRSNNKLCCPLNDDDIIITDLFYNRVLDECIQTWQTITEEYEKQLKISDSILSGVFLGNLCCKKLKKEDIDAINYKWISKTGHHFLTLFKGINDQCTINCDDVSLYISEVLAESGLKKEILNSIEIGFTLFKLERLENKVEKQEQDIKIYKQLFQTLKALESKTLDELKEAHPQLEKIFGNLEQLCLESEERPFLIPVIPKKEIKIEETSQVVAIPQTTSVSNDASAALMKEFNDLEALKNKLFITELKLGCTISAGIAAFIIVTASTAGVGALAALPAVGAGLVAPVVGGSVLKTKQSCDGEKDWITTINELKEQIKVRERALRAKGYKC